MKTSLILAVGAVLGVLLSVWALGAALPTKEQVKDTVKAFADAGVGVAEKTTGEILESLPEVP